MIGEKALAEIASRASVPRKMRPALEPRRSLTHIEKGNQLKWKTSIHGSDAVGCSKSFLQSSTPQELTKGRFSPVECRGLIEA
jgi:hypothetical protein